MNVEGVEMDEDADEGGDLSWSMDGWDFICAGDGMGWGWGMGKA